MTTGESDLPAWIADDEPPAYELVNTEGRGRAILVCDHASPVIPRRLGSLGLSPDDRFRHVAWDIGAAEVARRLSVCGVAGDVAPVEARLACANRSWWPAPRGKGKGKGKTKCGPGCGIEGECDPSVCGPKCCQYYERQHAKRRRAKGR